MQRMPALSRLAMRRQLSLGARRSPIEIVATMGTYVTRTQAAEVSGLRTGPFGRWADGVTAMRSATCWPISYPSCPSRLTW
jgi:hypothetical protein